MGMNGVFIYMYVKDEWGDDGTKAGPQVVNKQKQLERLEDCWRYLIKMDCLLLRASI